MHSSIKQISILSLTSYETLKKSPYLHEFCNSLAHKINHMYVLKI